MLVRNERYGKMSIYLDNAATTKPCGEAVSAAVDAMTENYGNPSSLHRAGLDAQLPRAIILRSGGFLPLMEENAERSSFHLLSTRP